MTTDIQPGNVIDGYVLDSYVGGGGFGAVWRGHNPATGDQVAIKFLNGSFSSSETARVRAEIELLAGAAGRESPNVVRVLGSGFHGAPYIILEFIEGHDLEALIRNQGRLSVARAIEIAMAVTSALQALNQAGIVHRDIKPANVMIDRSGVIKLADFGIAKIVGYETITMTGHAVMTMAYAAPEMWEDDGAYGKPSHRSDLYAMGVLIYECLTGVPPFRGNYGALYKAHTQLPPDLNTLPRGTPASLRELLSRCLAKRQYDRPRDAAECMLLLRRAELERREAEGVLAVGEPRHFGPWQRVSPHETQPYAWHVRHESTGQTATLEVLFTDDLDDGRGLRKASEATAALSALGAERILGTNRLLLSPSQEWAVQPPGRFEFWVAREDRSVPAAGVVDVPTLTKGVVGLAAIIEEAAGRSIPLALAGHTTLAADGSVYVRRPGLPPWHTGDDPAAAAMSYLRALSLDADALQLLSNAPDFAALTRSAHDWLVRNPAGAPPIVETPPPQTALTCPSCGAPVRPGESFCMRCGQPVGAAPQRPSQSRPIAASAATSIARSTPVPIPASVALSLTRSSAHRSVCEYDLQVRNLSQQPLHLRLDASTQHDTLAFSLPATLDLQPGGSERVHLRALARRPRRFGGRKVTPFTIAASSGDGGSGGPPVTIDGEFEESPSPLPALAGAGILGIGAIAVAAAMFLSGGDTEEDGPSAVAQGTATPIPTTVPPSPTPALPTVVPTPAPPPTTAPPVQANRMNCNAIRGTAYQSEAERLWFQANCSGPGIAPPAATATRAPSAAPQPTSVPAPPAVTTPTPGVYTFNQTLGIDRGTQATLTTIEYQASGRLIVNVSIKNISNRDDVTIMCQPNSPASAATQSGGGTLTPAGSFCDDNPGFSRALLPNATMNDYSRFNTSGLDPNKPISFNLPNYGNVTSIYLRR